LTILKSEQRVPARAEDCGRISVEDGAVRVLGHLAREYVLVEYVRQRQRLAVLPGLFSIGAKFAITAVLAMVPAVTLTNLSWVAFSTTALVGIGTVARRR
jgi:hypothetical protein